MVLILRCCVYFHGDDATPRDYRVDREKWEYYVTLVCLMFALFFTASGLLRAEFVELLHRCRINTFATIAN